MALVAHVWRDACVGTLNLGACAHGRSLLAGGLWVVGAYFSETSGFRVLDFAVVASMLLDHFKL